MADKSLVTDNLPALMRSLADLVKRDVLVGVPESTAARDGTINNATLAYIHDNGSPASNIPARPFMVPGIRGAQDRIAGRLKGAAFAALDGKPAIVEQQLTAAGVAAVSGIRGVIRAGIDPALSPATVAARRHSRQASSMRKGEKTYLAHIASGMGAAEAQSAAGITPLVNTGALRASITYLIRKT